MNDQGEDCDDPFQDANSGYLSDFFNSNGSFSTGSFSCDGGDDGAAAFVTVPLTDDPVIKFNQHVEMVCGDGTVKMIPLNMDGFFMSRQYESDPVDYGEDEDASVCLSELRVAEVPPDAAGGGLLPMAAEGVQALAAMGGDWATKGADWAVRTFGNTENEEEPQEGVYNDDGGDNNGDQQQQERAARDRDACDFVDVEAEAPRVAQ